ncbi:hypothetical protein SCP_1701200 [Sparassis crispa]|uniref:Uncharacterized protein n=1 Tax=Sparassis crispa TaxID=139825 RepID=A0A401H5T1_9APHY|nr:hypothetical protein SCP_1701200 [Sparassis crispa]GBE89795.1 hypothetical protein SCP_1701200 [Sparassis crispa]
MVLQSCAHAPGFLNNMTSSEVEELDHLYSVEHGLKSDVDARSPLIWVFDFAFSEPEAHRQSKFKFIHDVQVWFDMRPPNIGFTHAARHGTTTDGPARTETTKTPMWAGSQCVEYA